MSAWMNLIGFGLLCILILLIVFGVIYCIFGIKMALYLTINAKFQSMSSFLIITSFLLIPRFSKR